MIKAQQGKFFKYSSNTGTLTLSKVELGSADPANIWVQVMTAGGPKCSATLKPSELLPCAIGSNPMKPSSKKKSCLKK